ncbi:hypothetical protein C900_05885 [Fulvivirga imtechensis AK7]|uniref:Uncharacterized protein n=1 Tax=Fulvivirga imtechensis AK7 TaxID=1237149 RepID=L8JMU4_9BACT|nr:hypothetical protein C900_05885 [Fulvivirga imtechensis AK7]
MIIETGPMHSHFFIFFNRVHNISDLSDKDPIKAKAEN